MLVDMKRHLETESFVYCIGLQQNSSMNHSFHVLFSPIPEGYVSVLLEFSLNVTFFFPHFL